MCGRYALSTPPEVLAALLHLYHLRYNLVPRYNIAPTQTAPTARIAAEDDGERELVGMRWGLIPSWAKDASIGSRMINARSETAATKPAFRSAMKRRRCLVPASGFFEWKVIDARNKTKQPFYIHRADEQPLVMAGLWESWNDPESGEAIQTYTILTTDANDSLRDLHDRMPVILEPEHFDAWLDPDQEDAATLQSLLRPAAEGVLAMYPVSTRVNSPRNDEPELVEPVDGQGPKGGSGSNGGLFG